LREGGGKQKGFSHDGKQSGKKMQNYSGKTMCLSAICKLILISGCTLFFFLNTLLSAGPAFGIRLTNVKHLFNISHDFDQPSDVSVSKDGLIYVLDGVNGKVKVFDQDGNFKFSFGKRGTSKGRLNFPLGIDVDDSGRVYVADSGNHRVQFFNSDGSYINQVLIPSKDGNPSDPTDVAVNEAVNRLYVIDNNNHCFLAYDLSTLELTGTYGSPGIEKREFRYPFLAAIDNDDHIYITDVVNTRVQEFNPEGKFVTIIGGWGVKKGEFFRPKGIAVDKKNRVYVSDSYMGVIQIFKKDGQLHSAIGDPDTGSVKKFIKPMGIFVDNNNRLYVVEMFAERVSVYRIEENEK
jgi:DNA-binding beta-propeller fold protein YncE